MARDLTPQFEIDPWERARKIVRSLGDLSSSFTICVRSLLIGGRAMPGSRYSLSTRQHLERLLKSPTVVSHLYYAARTYHEEELQKLGRYTPMQMVELFTPPELAAVLTVMYAHRRLATRLDKKEWGAISAMMQPYVDLAVPLGQTIPALGPMRSLLVAAGRYMAWGAIALKDPKGIKKYRVAIKVKGLPYNLNEEMDNWGTTHVHIGATLFQIFGFGVETATGYLEGISTSDASMLSGEAKCYRVSQMWLDALVQNRSVPGESLGDDFFLSDDKMDYFVGLVESVLDTGSVHSWLDRLRSDIGPDITPALIFSSTKFSGSKRKVAADGSDDEDDEFAGSEA